ncbi:hypothetical protein [Longimycelium tulufanense]|uniref:hypothetical protein n=1 Tax=Longimycelium tulufanense TaxID=907463 RepID=UPI001E52CE9F|nr:hypothetical protein [Longimycelium tulufanense]
MPEIVRLSSADLLDRATELAAVLVDAVDDNAWIGFLAPLDLGTATSWWRELAPPSPRVSSWSGRPASTVASWASSSSTWRPSPTAGTAARSPS